MNALKSFARGVAMAFDIFPDTQPPLPPCEPITFESPKDQDPPVWMKNPHNLVDFMVNGVPFRMSKFALYCSDNFSNEVSYIWETEEKEYHQERKEKRQKIKSSQKIKWNKYRKNARLYI